MPLADARASSLQCRDVMTSDNSLSFSLILRRLDEVERKLDRILEELRTPTAISYSVRRGSHPMRSKSWRCIRHSAVTCDATVD